MLPVPISVSQWRNLAEQYATERKNLLPEEILAIIWKESTGNANAVNPSDPSFGLMQIEMNIARFYGGITNRQQLFTPSTNVSIGSAFLSHLKSSYSDDYPDYQWVAGYNEGETHLREGLKDQGYVDLVKAYIEAIQQQVYGQAAKS